MALLMNISQSHVGVPTELLIRTSSHSSYENCTEYSSSSLMMMEKRQLFLRSYQFCRKKSLTEKIKGSLIRVKKVMWFRLRSARKLRRLVWSKLRYAFYYRRGRRFLRLLYHNNHQNFSSCFW